MTIESEEKLMRALRAGIKPDERLTVSQWADKYRYLSPEASAEPGLWRTSRVPYMKEIMDKLSSIDPTEEVMLMKGAQIAAALDIETLLPTPTGWKRMGDIQVGDELFDENGNICRITFATEIMSGKQCYDLVFSDGSVIKADAEHRWSVSDDCDKRKVKTQKVLLTEEIYKTFKYRQLRNRYCIPVAKPLNLPTVDLPIGPYTLGAWLGDGNSWSNRITTHKDDADEMLSYIVADGEHGDITSKHSRGNCVEIVLRKPKNFCLRGHDNRIFGVKQGKKCAQCGRDASAKRPLSPIVFPKFGERIHALSLHNNKHIPVLYLRASFQQRLELLRGLMDTDGTISKKGYCSWTSSSLQLTRDMYELVSSLGLKPVINVTKGGRRATVDGVRYHIQASHYKITFQAFSETQVFNLRRKRDRMKNKLSCRHTETTRRRIVNVVQCESVPVRCIQVDSPSHLYLAGASMIPTHNTECGFNWVAYMIDVSPGPMLMVQPTDEMCRRNSKIRFDPMVEATHRLREKIRPKRSRDSGNTLLQKEFAGGVIVMTGANSAVGLRSMPVKYLFLDEIDGYPEDLDSEGSPIQLAMARTRTFARKKIYKCSTPTVEGRSAIDREFIETDQRYYHVPCPHCGTYQRLIWAQLKWELENPETAYYECDECGEKIEEHHKTMMLEAGKWVPSVPEKESSKRAGYHLSSLYSPLGWYSWSQAVHDFQRAKANPTELKVFVNTVLGETWKEKGEAPPWEGIFDRREKYQRNMPTNDVAFITAGVDVQADRLEVEIVGWCRGKVSYSIDYRVIDGDTSHSAVWNKLSEIVGEQWMREDGTMLPVRLMAVDTGYNTSNVYDFCRRFDVNRVIPIKGQDKQATIVGPPKFVDLTPQGKKVGKVRIYHIGVSILKSELYGWLRQRIAEDGTVPQGYCHFPEYGPEYFKGLTAEQLEFVMVKGYRRYQWVKKYQRNEPLDCRVYARAAAAVLGMDRWTDAHWNSISQPSAPRKKQPDQKQKRSGFWDR